MAAAKIWIPCWIIIKQQWTIEEISIFSKSSHKWRAGLSGHNFEWVPSCQVWLNLVQWFQRRRFKCERWWRMMESKWWQKLRVTLVQLATPTVCGHIWSWFTAAPPLKTWICARQVDVFILNLYSNCLLMISRYVLISRPCNYQW